MDETHSEGFVYIMRNASMPQVVKIGWTAKDPSERAKELSVGTGVPSPFSLVRAFATKWPEKVEEIVHASLSYCRLNPKREFFAARVPDDLHFKTDSEYDGYFGIEIENAIAIVNHMLKEKALQREYERLCQELTRRRFLFLDSCTQQNYPERWKEYQERLAKLREVEG